MTTTPSRTKHAAQPFVFSHQGDNPVDILLVGCVHGTGEPVLQKESGATFILANDFLKGRPWHTELSAEEKVKIAAALDHLRELGTRDLELQRQRRNEGN